MNDLNSVYIVGTVKKNNKKELVITNSSYTYDNEKKEYKTEKQDFNVILPYTVDGEALKRGMRIGINGKLRNVDGLTYIVPNNWQIL